MNIQDIENMTAAELKTNSDDIIGHLGSLDVGFLKERYLKTLADAKTRDEKLAKQGKTITMLQDAHLENVKQLQELESTNNLLNEQNVSLAEKMTAMEASHRAEAAATGEAHDKASVNLKADSDQKVERLESELGHAINSFTMHQIRGDRLKIQAGKNQSALSKAAGILNDAISFNQIDAADSGD